jgi:hypothetical protein
MQDAKPFENQCSHGCVVIGTLTSRQQSLKLTQVLESHDGASRVDVTQSEQLVYTASERCAYDETKYLAALVKRGLPLSSVVVAAAGKSFEIFVDSE